MTDLSLFSLRRFYDKILLSSFVVFLCLGQFLRLITIPQFPSHFSVVEGCLYALCMPLYFSRLRQTMLLVLIVVLSTAYGALCHRFDWTSTLFAFKVIGMIAVSSSLAQVFAARFNVEQCCDFLIRVFSVVAIFGFVIFFLFPKAHLFFGLLEGYGVHFTGDPHVRRFISPFFDPNYYAAIICFPLLLAMYRKKHLTAGLFMASLLLTFSRSGIASGVFLVFLCVRKFGLLTLMIGLVGIFFWSDLFHFFERTFAFGDDQSALVRFTTGKIAWEHFLERPLFGWGFHYSSKIFEEEIGRLSPDSSFLLTMIDFGLILTGCLILWGVMWAMRLWRDATEKTAELVFFVLAYLVICVLFTSQFNNLLYYPYFLIPFGAFLGFLSQEADESRVCA